MLHPLRDHLHLEHPSSTRSLGSAAVVGGSVFLFLGATSFPIELSCVRDFFLHVRHPFIEKLQFEQPSCCVSGWLFPVGGFVIADRFLFVWPLMGAPSLLVLLSLVRTIKLFVRGVNM